MTSVRRSRARRVRQSESGALAGKCALAVSLLVLLGSVGGGPAQAAPGTQLQAGDEAQIAVSVATIWTSPNAPRERDAKAIAAPALPGSWLAGLNTAGRRGLNGRVETQALLGDDVRISAISGRWAKVTVTGQASPKSGAGYPGWVPLAQLGAIPAAEPTQRVTVTATKTKLFLDDQLSGPMMTISYGTELPVLSRMGKAVEVLAGDGMVLYVSAAAVRDAAPQPTGAALVAQAKRFRGLAYLWGGTSAFGFDCSGFTYAIYRHFGIAIPRDATPQYNAGTPVSKAALRPGDLVFFRNATGIHHVGMYVGGNKMIHSPRTGSSIQTATLASGIWAREFAGGRRYI